jgi:hypothetical protein
VKRSPTVWVVDRRFILGGQKWSAWRPQFEIRDARVERDSSPSFQMRQLLKEHVAFWSADWERLWARHPERPRGPSIRLRRKR